MEIAPEVAQALADVANAPTLVFSEREAAVTWPNGTRLVLRPSVGDETLVLAYDLAVK